MATFRSSYFWAFWLLPLLSLLNACGTKSARWASPCAVKSLGSVADYKMINPKSGKPLYTLTLGRPQCAEQTNCATHKSLVRLPFNAHRMVGTQSAFIKAPVFIAAIDENEDVLYKQLYQVNYDMKGDHTATFTQEFVFDLPKDVAKDHADAAILLLVGFQLDKPPEA